MTRTWYRIAVAPKVGAPRVFAAHGEHLGDAVAAAVRRVASGRAIAAALVAPDAVPLGESVGKDHVAELDEVVPPAGFAWPAGVLPVLGSHATLAREGHIVRPAPQLVIEAQPSADQLVDVFLGMIERLPAADNLEIRILDHFEPAGPTDVWLTARVDAKRILRMLDDHDVELLANGHVELSVYVRAHKATLRLTEHKTVVWLAEERALEREVQTWFGELGMPAVDDLPTLAAVPHFHYRAAKSRARAQLADHLFRQRLRRVARLEAPVADTAG